MDQTKEYIEREYKLAISNYNIARSEDERWDARKTMARLEALAAELYGFDYVSKLEIMKK